MSAARTALAAISSSTTPCVSFIDSRMAIMSRRERSSRLAVSPVMRTTRWGPGGNGLAAPGAPSAAAPPSREPPASGRAGGAPPPVPADPPAAPPLPPVPRRRVPPLPPVAELPPLPPVAEPPLPALADPPLPPPPLPAVGRCRRCAAIGGEPGSPESGVHESERAGRPGSARRSVGREREAGHDVGSCFQPRRRQKKFAKNISPRASEKGCLQPSDLRCRDRRPRPAQRAERQRPGAAAGCGAIATLPETPHPARRRAASPAEHRGGVNPRGT